MSIADDLRRAMAEWEPPRRNGGSGMQPLKGSVRTLSKLTGIKTSTLYAFRKGRASFRLDTAERICRVLGLGLRPI